MKAAEGKGAAQRHREGSSESKHGGDGLTTPVRMRTGDNRFGGECVMAEQSPVRQSRVAGRGWTREPLIREGTHVDASREFS